MQELYVIHDVREMTKGIKVLDKGQFLGSFIAFAWIRPDISPIRHVQH
jgi:hypothetical protein